MNTFNMITVAILFAIAPLLEITKSDLQANRQQLIVDASDLENALDKIEFNQKL